jgi:NAD(P)-dependent dehydrogenase (short-subunit alcohol dehydrogenase family)
VGVLDLDGERARKVAEELRAGSAQAIASEVDVADPRSLGEALRRVRGELGPVEILVTSAGIAPLTGSP